MNVQNRKREVIILLTILVASLVSITFASESTTTILSIGTVVYQQDVYVNVGTTNVAGTNKLALGFQLSYGSLGVFQKSSQLRNLAKQVGFRLVRFFDGLTSQYIPSMMPCTFFNETNGTGTYNWTSVDDVVGNILAIGAQPLIALGWLVSGVPVVPPGMSINTTTGLPNPQSYAAYASEWVRHFKAKGWTVSYYEILNEPWVYFGNPPTTAAQFQKLQYYMQLFATCRQAMKLANPQTQISFDYICRKEVLDYWLANSGADVDTLNFHKYDEWRNPAVKTEAQLITEAENLVAYYRAPEAQQVWFQRRGTRLPILCTESNMNGASPTTDPRLQQMSGAVWLSLLLRSEILNGVSYHVYFELGSSYYSNAYGFGMINDDGLKPWYPYYVQNIIGQNLEVGDPIYNATTDSTDLRTLAWRNQGITNILLINKSTKNLDVHLQGISGAMNLSKIDSTIDWTTPRVQTGSVDSSQPVTLNGYTVALLQMATS